MNGQQILIVCYIKFLDNYEVQGVHVLSILRNIIHKYKNKHKYKNVLFKYKKIINKKAYFL